MFLKLAFSTYGKNVERNIFCELASLCDVRSPRQIVEAGFYCQCVRVLLENLKRLSKGI